MAELLVIVPTRGRPGNIRRLVEAWDATQAFDDAALLFVLDGDDPERRGYTDYLDAIRAMDLRYAFGLQEIMFAEWQPMVAKLNAGATTVAGQFNLAVGFAGDDHLPRTAGWARAYLDALRELGTGIVYGDDRHWSGRLCTEWAMTSDIVRALGRMVPAPVEHLYSDNSVMAVGQAVGCIRYLPDVVIEHMHPVYRKAQSDEQYRRVNSKDQYRRDGDAYKRWLADGLDADAAAVRALREVVTVDGVREG